MATATSRWDRTTNPDTGEVDFYTEASKLGIKPGEHPGSRSLPEGHFALAHQWSNVTSQGELIAWAITLSSGTTYTIFND